MTSVKKVTLVYLNEDEEEVLKELGKTGKFEPKEIDEEKYPELKKAPSRRDDYQALINRLKSLKNDLYGEDTELEKPDRKIKEINYMELERKIEELEKKATGKIPSAKTKKEEEFEALEELEQLIQTSTKFKAELESSKLAKEEIQKAKKEIEGYEEEEESQEGYLEEISYLTAVAKYSDFISKGREKTLRGEKISVLQGWVAKKNFSNFKNFLESIKEKVEGKISVQVEDPDPDENTPTIMKNSPPLKGHEGLTRQYAIPSSGEIDPTPFTAILWSTMFGFMFADWGQGLLLFSFGLLLVSVDTEVIGFPSKSLGKLLIGCGLSATLFGLLTGEFFLMEGFPLHSLLHLGAHWAEKSSNIIWVLKIALVFGIAQIVLGFILGIKNSLSKGHKIEALLGEHGFAGLVTFVSLVLFAFKFLADQTGNLEIVPGIVITDSGFIWPILGLLIGSLTIMFAPIFEGEGIELGIGLLIEALISFLSNMLSYIRLAGFLLFHVALSLVVANMGIRTPLGLGFFILLNALTLTLEFMVVGIQALRLLFYEFFSKFFVGGGKLFHTYKVPQKLRGVV